MKPTRNCGTNSSKPGWPKPDVLAQLAEPRRIESLQPIGARFVYSIRLVALYERAGRDPVPELAVRLGHVATACKTLALADTISATWPDTIHVSRFCCCLMSHDEATIGRLIDTAANRDYTGFKLEIDGLVRPQRIERLWDAALDLVVAELSAGPSV